MKTRKKIPLSALCSVSILEHPVLRSRTAVPYQTASGRMFQGPIAQFGKFKRANSQVRGHFKGQWQLPRLCQEPMTKLDITLRTSMSKKHFPHFTACTAHCYDYRKYRATDSLGSKSSESHPHAIPTM